MEFVKVTSRMLQSSIWEEDSDTRVVWFTLMLLMDPSGFVKCCSVGRLAALANVSEEAAGRAIQKFLSPDPLGLTQEHQGRRISEVPGGWMVLNGPKYLLTTQREAWREAQKRCRERKKGIHRSHTTLDERLKTKPDAESF